jgi:hypothetical protein
VNRIFAIPLTVFCLMTTTESAAAQMHRPVSRISVRADSRLWLEGTSNVRDWTCRATQMDATIEVGSSDTSSRAQFHPDVVKGVSVKVPVRSLKCGDRHMEQHMYEALKSTDAAPGFITASIAEISPSVVTGQKTEAEVQLTIAGVQRSVRMTVVSDLMPDGTRRARGTVPMLMTDFGIRPPRPWGGLLRCADRVLIQFEIFIPAQT